MQQKALNFILIFVVVFSFFAEGHILPRSYLMAQQATGNRNGWNTEAFWITATLHTVKNHLKSGADPNARNERGEFPLHVVALRPENSEIVTAMWKEGQRPPHYRLNLPDENTDIITALIKAGANPNAKNKNGQTPLHAAILKGGKMGKNLPVILSLLKAGADPNAQDKNGWNSLHYATYNKAAQAIKNKGGANLKAWAKDVWTPLDTPTIKKNLVVIHALVEAGANPNALENNGDAPLTFAAAIENPAPVTALIKAGANPNLRMKGDLTPLHVAAFHNQNPDVITALVEAGADPNSRAELGITPLHAAALFNRNPKVIATLCASGGDIDSQTDNGDTVLDCAAVNKNLEVAALVKAIKRANFWRAKQLEREGL